MGETIAEATVEATLSGLSSYPGVVGCVVVTQPGGKLLRVVGLEQAAAADLVRVVPALAELCRAAVRELDPQNDLEIVRLRTTKHREVMVVYNEAYLVVALQDMPQAAGHA